MDSDLTLRRQVVGGRIRRSPAVTLKYYGEPLTRIILIHGFDTNEDEALEKFEIFKANASLINRSFGEKIFVMAWPSDRWTINPIQYYKKNIGSAEECARALAKFIRESISQERVPCEYVFVAHSLGCRLVVFLLRELKLQGVCLKSRFKVFLMAAAIPVELLSMRSDIRDALDDVPLSAVMYSPADGVLKSLFRAGEAKLKGLSLSIPEAVGLNGRPSDDLWTYREKMPDFGHGYYWVKGDSAKFIADKLGFAVDRSIAERYAPAVAPIGERDELEMRRMGAWSRSATLVYGGSGRNGRQEPLDTGGQDPLEQLHAQRAITDGQYDAGRQFYAHWYLSGIGPNIESRHRKYLSRIAPQPTMLGREHEFYYGQRHLDDLACIGGAVSGIVRAVVLDGLEPEYVGNCYLGRTGRRARDSVIDILRAVLDALIKHYDQVR